MTRLVLALALAAITVAALACGGESDGGAATPEADAGAEQTATAQPEETSAEEPEAVATETAGSMEDDADQAEPAAEAMRTAGQYEGYTFAVSEGSEATFTVEEQLTSLDLPNDAVMRTSSLSGTVAFDGSESLVTIELRTLSSDSQYRDGYVRNRMFGTHPTATVTVPGTLPLPDGFADGNEVTTQVETSISMLGGEFPLTFDIEARDDGHTVFVVGRATFTWDQFGITKPTARSVVWLKDEVRVEVLLALKPDPAP